MGNPIGQLLLVITLVVVCLSGCEVVNDVAVRQQQAVQLQQTQTADLATPPPVEAGIHCPDPRRDECGLLVTLHGQDEPVDLNIQLRIDDEIVFRTEYNEAIVVDENGTEARKDQVRIMPQETRKILFPYQIDSPVLPGAYRVEVVATNANTSEVFGETAARVFIYLDDEGQFHMLSSESEYANRFTNSFSDGKLTVSYNIVLEEKERPRQGTLLVRIDSEKDDYAPTLEIESMGGIKFVPGGFGESTISEFGKKVSREFPLIDKDGARIAQFPFVYDKNAQLVEGVYSFVTTLRSTTEGTLYESAPVAIKVVSDPVYREERWLEEAFLEPYIIDEFGIGAVVVDAPMQTNVALAQQDCETNWVGANFPSQAAKPDWNFKMSDFNGTLCQLFLMRYAGRVAVDWNEFSITAIAKNDNIDSAYEELKDHEIYWMPRPVEVP